VRRLALEIAWPLECVAFLALVIWLKTSRPFPEWVSGILVIVAFFGWMFGGLSTLIALGE